VLALKKKHSKTKELKKKIDNKRDIQKIIERKWRVDNGDEAIIKRA
jgi:hypothetical protein